MLVKLDKKVVERLIYFYFLITEIKDWNNAISKIVEGNEFTIDSLRTCKHVHSILTKIKVKL